MPDYLKQLLHEHNAVLLATYPNANGMGYTLYDVHGIPLLIWEGRDGHTWAPFAPLIMAGSGLDRLDAVREYLARQRVCANDSTHGTHLI